ncbi:hypothetical protein DFS33DRAFT_362444 [Desarmillaria ectypa]|nr:hypothetical protein DFS33DRAFT_362444 [Desarmillaria ectypa]
MGRARKVEPFSRYITCWILWYLHLSLLVSIVRMAYATPHFTTSAMTDARCVACTKLPSAHVSHSFSSTPPTSYVSLAPEYGTPAEYHFDDGIDGPPSPTSTLVGSDDSHERGLCKDKVIAAAMPHLIALADWVAVVLVCAATGQTPTVLQTVSELSFSATYEDLHGFVYDLIMSQHQTPFTLFHIVAYATLYFEKVEPLTLRKLEDKSKNVETFRKLMLTLFFVALDQFNADPLPLETRAVLTGFTVDQVLEAQEDVLETLGSYVQMPRDVWNIYTKHFRELCAQSWLPVHNDHNVPAIVNAFLTLSEFTSSTGSLPLYEVPLSWLVPSVTKQAVSPIARPSSATHLAAVAEIPSSPSEWNPCKDPVVPHTRRHRVTSSTYLEVPPSGHDDFIPDFMGMPIAPKRVENELDRVKVCTPWAVHQPKPRHAFPIDIDLLARKANMWIEQKTAAVRRYRPFKRVPGPRPARVPRPF